MPGIQDLILSLATGQGLQLPGGSPADALRALIAPQPAQPVVPPGAGTPGSTNAPPPGQFRLPGGQPQVGQPQQPQANVQGSVPFVPTIGVGPGQTPPQFVPGISVGSLMNPVANRTPVTAGAPGAPGAAPPPPPVVTPPPAPPPVAPAPTGPQGPSQAGTFFGQQQVVNGVSFTWTGNGWVPTNTLPQENFAI